MNTQHPASSEKNISLSGRVSSGKASAGSGETRKTPVRFSTLSRWVSEDNYRGSHGPVGKTAEAAGRQAPAQAGAAAVRGEAAQSNRRLGADAPDSGRSASSRTH